MLLIPKQTYTEVPLYSSSVVFNQTCPGFTLSKRVMSKIILDHILFFDILFGGEKCAMAQKMLGNTDIEDIYCFLGWIVNMGLEQLAHHFQKNMFTVPYLIFVSFLCPAFYFLVSFLTIKCDWVACCWPRPSVTPDVIQAEKENVANMDLFHCVTDIVQRPRPLS